MISHEDLIGFYEIEKTDAVSMATVIKDILEILDGKKYTVSATIAAVP